MAKVLEGIRVLDFSRYVSGPYASMLLADMGADVIKVERPGGSDDRGLGPKTKSGESLPYGIILARNKRGITLDIGCEVGADLLARLVQKSDVVLHNFVAGTAEAQILDYQRLNAINPKIIVAALSGFGQTGPYAGRTAFDSVAQALSGIMSYTGYPGTPPTRAGAPIADVAAGTQTALGIMFALFHRQRTGEGQFVDIAMLDSLVSMANVMGAAAEYKLTGSVRRQQGNHSFWCYADLLEARDGWVMINVMSDSLWRRLCRTVGKNEWVNDARFKDNESRYANQELISAEIRKWTASKSCQEVIDTLEKARVPCGKVNDVREMTEDPQIRAREMLVDLDYPGVGQVPLPGTVVKMSATPGSVNHRAPKIGEHNSDIYGRLLGLSPERIHDLLEMKAI